MRADRGSDVAFGASAINSSDDEEDAAFFEAEKVAAAAAEANELAYNGRQRLESLQQLQADVAQRAAHARRALYMIS